MTKKTLQTNVWRLRFGASQSNLEQTPQGNMTRIRNMDKQTKVGGANVYLHRPQLVKTDGLGEKNETHKNKCFVTL